MGFPTRNSANSMVKKTNLGGLVGDPTKFENADEMNLKRWQLGAMGGTLPICQTVFKTATTTGAMVLVSSREAWNPELIQAAPTLARTSAGIYTVTFPALVPDEAGNSVAVQIFAAKASIQALTPGFAQCLCTGNNVITVYLFTAAAAAADQLAAANVPILITGV